MGFITDIFTGGSSKSQDRAADTANAVSQEQLQMARQLWSESAPIRNPVYSRLTDFMNGDFDPTASAMYAPLKSGVENAYGLARNNLMSQVAGGGALTEGLAGLENSRAKSLSDVIAQLVADEYSKAYGIASGSPQQSTSALAGAGTTSAGLTSGLASLYGQKYASNNNLLGMLGAAAIA